MKTSELTGAALDWAVAKCEGVTVLPKMRGGCYATLVRGETVLLCYSTDWAQGGPIIARERMDIKCWDFHSMPWKASMNTAAEIQAFGPTPLIAAMRCYVASKLGDEVEVPDELKGE